MKAFKKLTALLCAAVMLMSFPVAVSHADDDIDVYLNDSWIEFEDQRPVIIDGRTLVPMRAVFEAMGAEVEWEGDYHRVTIYTSDKYIMLYIGEYTVIYGYEQGDYEDSLDLDVPPQIINGRTMLPLRAVSELLGAGVEWNEDTRSVYIWSELYSGEPELPLYDDTNMDELYFDTYSDIPNFGWYINENPYMSSEGEYFFDYLDYDDDIDVEIDNYISDLEYEGFKLKNKYDTNGAVHYTLSGDKYSIKFINDYSLNHVEIYITENENHTVTPKPTATLKPTATPAPTATPKPTQEPTQAPAFKYLKDMGWHIGYKDYDMNEVSSVSGNAVQFKVYLSAKKNEWLDKGDEAGIDAEFDLDGEYSRLTGVMHGSGTKLSLRFYCDGSLEKEYTGVYSDTNLDLDVSGCKTLRIEAYGVVGSTSAIPNIKIKDAKLWYDE